MRAALDRSGLSLSRLELEITEAVMLQDTTATLATLHAFHALGVSIAMDDFGTGYSSLSYLHRFPFDRIKIDQSFVRELGKQPDCEAIVRSVTALSRELRMASTAEGVETPEQLHTVISAGCTVAQGYLFSKPVPEAEISGWQIHNLRARFVSSHPFFIVTSHTFSAVSFSLTGGLQSGDEVDISMDRNGAHDVPAAIALNKEMLAVMRETAKHQEGRPYSSGKYDEAAKGSPHSRGNRRCHNHRS